MSANYKEKNRGIRVYLYKKELEKFDLENAPLSLIQSYIQHGRESYHLKTRIKELEKQNLEILDKLDRLTLLSSEAFSLLSQFSTIDQFKIEKMKFHQDRGEKLNADDETIIEVSKAKEENFKDFLAELFPEIRLGILKLMVRSNKYA